MYTPKIRFPTKNYRAESWAKRRRGRQCDGRLGWLQIPCPGAVKALYWRFDHAGGTPMKDDNTKRLRADRVYLTQDGCDLDAFRALVERSARRADYPFAADIVSNVPIYDGDAVREAAAFPETRREMMAEWVEAMTDGPGIIVVRRAFADLRPIEDANALFWAMIDEQNRNNSARGDHFAKPGANDRVWNALEKLCLADPAVFAAYYGNDIIALVSAGLARARLPDHLAAQRGQSGRRGAGSPSRLSHGLPDGARDRALSRARPPSVADADAAGRGRALRHAARNRARRSTCRFRRPICPATSRHCATTSAPISRRTRSSCR